MTGEVAAWRDYWMAGGGQDAVSTGQAGAALAEFWRAKLLALPLAPDRIADLACGLGPVAKSARVAFGEVPGLVACDISAEGAKRAADRCSGCAVAADGAALPFAEASFDLVVSQFGLEYAGETAFSEAGRVLAPHGGGLAVVHLSGGAIERECADNLAILDAFFSSGLLEAAREAVQTGRSRDLVAEKRMTLVAAAANARPGSSAARFAAATAPDIARLACRPDRFERAEALAYVDAQFRSVGAYRARMRTMTGAALDETAARRALDHFSRGKASAVQTLSGPGGPYAWFLAVGAAVT